MKKIALGALCLLILSAPLFADMSKGELQKMYLDYLRSQNIRASVDSDGDIEFRYEGSRINELTFYIVVDEADQQYFQIIAIGIYYLDTEAQRSRAFPASAVASRRADAAKIYVVPSGEYINAKASVFLVSPQDFMDVFPKLMRGLDDVMYYFLTEMN